MALLLYRICLILSRDVVVDMVLLRQNTKVQLYKCPILIQPPILLLLLLVVAAQSFWSRLHKWRMVNVSLCDGYSPLNRGYLCIAHCCCCCCCVSIIANFTARTRFLHNHRHRHRCSIIDCREQSNSEMLLPTLCNEFHLGKCEAIATRISWRI